MSEDKSKIKNELPMNVLVCGTEIKKDYIMHLFDDKIKNSAKYIHKYKYTEYNYLFGWKFQFFEDGLEEKNLKNINSKIKKDYNEIIKTEDLKDSLEKAFKDTIVCFIEDSLKKAKEVITFFSKEKVIYHTFIIFITINKDITFKVLKDFIDNDLEDEYDARNIDVINYNDKERLPFPLFEALFYKSCYFNEVGNELILPNINMDINEINEIKKEEKRNHCFNFLIIGKPGTGKSTFINIMNGAKVAKEGTGGGKVTYNICKYTVKNEKNLMLYDTPGFGQNKELENVENYIINEIDEMKKIKEKFHCVIYMLSYLEERNFEQTEKNLINNLLKLNIPFYFVLNKSQKPKDSKKKKKKRNDKKNILEEEISIHFPEKKDLIKVICLNLKVNDSDDCFGMDLLFNDLYNYYSKHKIDIDKLKSFSGNTKHIGELLKNSPFFENLTCKEEILESIEIKCKKETYAFSAAAAGVGFIPIPMSDWPILVAIQTTMVIVIASEFGKSLKKSEASDIIKNLTKSTAVGAVIAGAGKLVGSFIKLFPGIGTAVGGAISGSTAGAGTLALGFSAIAFFKPQFTSGEIYEFFKNRAQAFNNTIDKFKKYADLFSKSDNYMYLMSSK